MPFEVRKEMIKTLFGRRDVLTLGCIAHVACVFVAWGATGDKTYLAWAPLFVIVSAARLAFTIRFDAVLPDITSMRDLDRWEWGYMIISAGTSILVGTVAAYSGLADPYSIAPAVGQGLVGGTMITIVGRNFGSLKHVITMIVLCCGPMALSFIFSGWIEADFFISMTGLPIFIMIMVAIGTSTYLYGLMLDALKTKRQSEIAFQKFEAAIASMPNGLIVVDGNQRMIVINKQAQEALADAHEGENLFEAIRGAIENPDVLTVTLTRGLEDGCLEDADFETRDGRWLRFGIRRLDSGATKYLDAEWGGKQEGAYILTILDVTKKVEDDRKLEHLARYDGLTGLANRRWWEDNGQSSVRDLPRGSLVALAVLDIDRFKLINDTLGHHTGDKVIQGVADRIRSMDEPRAFAGRLGGDEFVVLLLAPESIDEARAFYDRMFAAICTTYPIEGHNIEVRCSGGVIVRRQDEFNILTDLSRADLALYKVKRTSQPWMLFDDKLEKEYQSSVRIKHDLKDAIEKGALELVYQPIYDARGERIVSAEALCRWDHYEAGAIPPSQFIAMAEEIGVIGQLTEYVLRRACRECMTWNADVSVAVNLSALDLARDGIVELIVSALADAGMPPDRLCVEVTETVFVKDFEKTAATLLKLRGMGVKTSLDDFGTGYSSLSYMHRLPLNRVKIDQSFVATIVSDTKTQQLFSAVVGLAKGLGFEVVVEGVEDRGQLERVVSVPGVDMIQGHIFSRGLTNADMAVLGSVRRPSIEGKVIRLVRDAAV
ncbi:Phytochrome-like protein cph2 [compost metagenome]